MVVDSSVKFSGVFCLGTVVWSLEFNDEYSEGTRVIVVAISFAKTNDVLTVYIISYRLVNSCFMLSNVKVTPFSHILQHYRPTQNHKSTHRLVRGLHTHSYSIQSHKNKKNQT